MVSDGDEGEELKICILFFGIVKLSLKLIPYNLITISELLKEEKFQYLFLLLLLDTLLGFLTADCTF